MNRLQELAGLKEKNGVEPAADGKVQGIINTTLFKSLNIPNFNPSAFSTTIGKVKSGTSLSALDNKILANIMTALIKTSDDALLSKIFANLKQVEAKP